MALLVARWFGGRVIHWMALVVALGITNDYSFRYF